MQDTTIDALIAKVGRFEKNLKRRMDIVKARGLRAPDQTTNLIGLTRKCSRLRQTE